MDIDLDTRGMSCAQATFQTKRILLENTGENKTISVLTNSKSAAESIMRASERFRYSLEIKEIEDDNFLLVFKAELL